MTRKTLKVLLKNLKDMEFQHLEILDIIRAVNLDFASSYVGSNIEIGDTENSHHFLIRATIVEGDKNCRLKGWEEGPAFTADVFDEVVKLAHELRTSREQSHVLSRIMFSERELLGSWKYKDYCQILPCLHDIKVGQGLDWYNLNIHTGIGQDPRGPPFPFLIEVNVPKISNEWLQNQFAMKLLDRFEHLLCTFVVGVSNSALWPNDRQWTALKSNDDGGIDYHLLHSGIGTQSGGRFDTWTVWSGKRVPLFVGQYYDDSLEPYQLDELVLPEDLEQLFDSYFQLGIGNRRNFDRAAYFFTIGQKLRNNGDLSTMNFSIAVECLLDSKQVETCSTCGAQSEGTTKRFKQFMEKYAPVSEVLADRRNKLYAIRSLIVHGSRSMISDVNFFSLARDRETPKLMDWLIRKSLKNWLRATIKTTS